MLCRRELLTQESKKLTFGAPTVIRPLHDFKGLLSHKSMTLLSPHIQLFHATLLEFPKFSFERCPTLNPATQTLKTSLPLPGLTETIITPNS